MWIVAKYRSKELNNLKKNLVKTVGDRIDFYIPKIKCHKYVNNKLKTLEKLILGNYLIFYHNKFCDDSVLVKLKYIKGLEYVLKNFKHNQNEIKSFIDHCKSFEDENGYLTQDFFEDFSMKKGKFISGPFTNMVFSIISNQKTKIKILIGNITTTISKKSGYLYRAV